MPQILRLFHGSAIVEDLLVAARFYHDFFGSWVYEAQHLGAENAVNSANVIGGGFSLEMLSPLNRDEPTAVARFLRRHGSHFTNIAFWVEDCRGVAQKLLDHGVRVSLREHGIVESLDDQVFDYMVTHPKDTGGTVFEFLEDQKIHDPRHEPWWDDRWWREQHPLGIESLSYSTVVVGDLEKATSFYADTMGCRLIHEDHDAARNAQCRFFSVGDTVVELAAPEDSTSEMAKDLEEHGSIIHSFTFKVADLECVERHAATCELDLRVFGTRGLELDPSQTSGGRFGFVSSDPYA